MKRWPDEAPTEPLPLCASREFDDQQPADPPLRQMKLLFAVATLAAVAATVAVALHMSNQSEASAPTADAQRGDCLTWPPGAPERAMQVDCADEHLFEVADSEAMEISSDPAKPAAEGELGQICARAVARYLGPRYDPGGRFVVGMVWTPLASNRQLSGRLMCGLQLASDGIASVWFRGRVANQDQSSVWPAGTCLGIRDGQPTEVAVDCAVPHALEITGAIDLSTVFGQAAPSTAAQDAVVRDACGAATSAYLAPKALGATGLTLRYQPIEATGWIAGTRRIACRIGSAKPDGGWATLRGAAKTGVLIDGRPAAALPSPADVTAPVVETLPESPSAQPLPESAPPPG